MICKAYIRAGLDPGRFWEITLRLALLEMEAAEVRADDQRELIWWGAHMPHLKTPIPLDKFVGRRPDPARRVSDFHKVWDRVDRALARGNRA